MCFLCDGMLLEWLRRDEDVRGVSFVKVRLGDDEIGTRRGGGFSWLKERARGLGGASHAVSSYTI